MLKKTPLALGLVLVCTSSVWAGATGNGSPQPTGHYGFCYAGNPKVVYFTQIITMAPSTNPPNLGVEYGNYVQKTYGLPSIDRERCVTAATSALAEAEKQRYLQMLGSSKPVETQWTGTGTQ